MPLTVTDYNINLKSSSKLSLEYLDENCKDICPGEMIINLRESNDVILFYPINNNFNTNTITQI